MTKSLKERVQEFGNSLPCMLGRTKGELKLLFDEEITITDFGFLTDGKKNTDYACFIVKENKDNFFFGGLVLTNDLKVLEEEGYREEIIQNGLPVRLTNKVSKDHVNYTAVEYL